jgi:signal transduction histidine kinase
LNLPPDWIVTIGDRAGTTIARSREAERFVGQMGRPAALERLRASDEGWFALTSREGIPLYVAFAHVKISGWSVAVGIPDRVLFAPVRRSTWILILAGGAVLALALVLATAIGQRIAGAITVLAGYADAVGRGERIDLPDTRLQETDAVARSLHLASERLQQSTRERAMLLDRTVTAQEAERRRIARELHDSLGQYLTALRLGFNAIEPHCASNEAAQQRLHQLKVLAADLGRELNRMAWELRPMALDDLGLQRAVTQYLEEWADRSRLHIDLEIDLGDRRLSQPVETALFRVLQEAITNVAKHACADRVSVILGATGREARLIVEDDGKGFDVVVGVEGHELSIQHLGLLGVRERLAVVGGSLEVESSTGGGTTVYVRIPL